MVVRKVLFLVKVYLNTKELRMEDNPLNVIYIRKHLVKNPDCLINKEFTLERNILNAKCVGDHSKQDPFYRVIKRLFMLGKKVLYAMSAKKASLVAII
jgi:hypothetical protein